MQLYLLLAVIKFMTAISILLTMMYRILIVHWLVHCDVNDCAHVQAHVTISYPISDLHWNIQYKDLEHELMLTNLCWGFLKVEVTLNFRQIKSCDSFTA